MSPVGFDDRDASGPRLHLLDLPQFPAAGAIYRFRQEGGADVRATDQAQAGQARAKEAVHQGLLVGPRAARKAEPYRSALSMLVFHINRGGKNLPARQRRVLEQTKLELKKQFHRA